MEARTIHSVHVDTAVTWRGGQNQVLLTALGLEAAGHRTTLVAHPDGVLRRRAREGLSLVPLGPRGEADFTAAWRLSALLKRERPDIVHAHDPHAVSMAALAISFDTRGPWPTLVASRRVDFHLKKNAFSRWKYRQVTRFICASEAIRQILISDGIPADRAVTVHEGVDLAHIDAQPPVDVHETFWLPRNAPVVLNIGALVPHKGQKDFIDAASLVLRHVPDARFLILGAGELQHALEQQIKRLSLERHVLLAGFRPDVLSLLKGVDVFVMSSVLEGLGTSILDAMACGKPTVGTRVGGIPEVVVDQTTGLLVPTHTPARMADAIEALLSDAPRREAMGAAARRHVERHFTVERMVAGTVEVYLDVAGTRPPGDTDRSPARD